MEKFISENGSLQEEDIVNLLCQDFFSKLDKIEPDFIKNDIDPKYMFFRLEDQDISEHEENDLLKTFWIPFEKEECIFLEYWYQKYLKGNLISPIIGDFIIDFKRMFLYNFGINLPKSPILRKLPEEIQNLHRNRYKYDSNFNLIKNNKKEISIKNMEIFDKEAKKFLIKIYKFHHKLVELPFEIISKIKNLKICFDNDLKDLISRVDLKQSFDEFIKKLRYQINMLCINYKRYNFYEKQYLDIITEDNFFHQIMKMYSEEGFLYTLVNEILKENYLTLFPEIKYYYLSLLASYEYFSKFSSSTMLQDINIPQPTKEKIEKTNSFIVYRGSFLQDEEISSFKDISENEPLIKRYDELISTSLNKEFAKSMAKNCLITLRINYNSENYRYNYVYLDSSLSAFSNQNEVLLRNGCIIRFHELKKKTSQIKEPFYYIKGTVLFTLENEILNLNYRDFKLDLRNLSLAKKPMLSDYLLLSLRNNNLITHLDLGSNEFGTKPQLVKSLAEIIRNNRKLIHLDLGVNSLGKTQDNIKHLTNSLMENKNIKELYLYLNSIGNNDESILYLSELIKRNKTISKLDLSINNLGRNIQNIELISEAFIINKNILELNLSDTSICNNLQNVKMLSKVILDNKTITKLDISSNSIGSDAMNVQYLSEALKDNKSITHLILNDNDLGGNLSNIQFLSDFIGQNNSINHLELSGNYLGDNSENVQLLSEALKINNSIIHLCLVSNLLGNEHENVEYISNVILKNNHISILDIGDNNLGSNPNNIRCLTDSLIVNTTITNLYLWNNNLGVNEDNINFLLNAMKHNKTIQEYNLSSNNLGNSTQIIENLSNTIRENTIIKELDLGSNYLGVKPDNFKLLSEALKQNTSLIRLNLSHNYIGDKSITISYVRDVLSNNNFIKCLNLRSNSLNSHFLEEIKEVTSIQIMI